MISCDAVLVCLCHQDLCLIIPSLRQTVENEQHDETSVELLPHDHMSSNIPSLGMERGYCA
jgi:hypothetical protein